MSEDERFRLTAEGAAMVTEMNYGHNPLAYLCSERPTEQKPVPHELCIRCADGFEAVTWKRRAVRAEAALRRVEAVMDRINTCRGMVTDRPGEARAYDDAGEWIRRALDES